MRRTTRPDRRREAPSCAGRPLRRDPLSWVCGLVLLLMAVLPGCRVVRNDKHLVDDASLLQYKYASTRIDYPNVEAPDDYQSALTQPPMTVDTHQTPEYWDMKLEEAIRLALTNNKVLRDLGAALLTNPATANTIHDPAIIESDPRFGVQAALSAFDASFAHSTFLENNDRLLNNTFFGGGTRNFEQSTVVAQSQITKLAVTGTKLTLRNITNYDDNNAPGNRFGTIWENFVEAEARHPLLLGGGVDFNRIAGPTDTPGVYGGVVIARINMDISLTDFEMSVRDFVSNIENAYWDLYYAYRDLDAKRSARDAALETWRKIHALYITGRRGGEAEKEAQSREQYFRFEQELQNALSGAPGTGTTTNNGISGGAFRGVGGVYFNERRLRVGLGLPVTDGRLIRPADEPILAKVSFNWDDILAESLTRRAELRRQRWTIKRREKEYLVARRFLLPTFDLVGLYRWRGFGRDLFPTGNDSTFGDEDALANLTRGQFTEWQAGVELSFPFGQRRGHAAVRNAELLLARERAILREQERTVALGLSNAIAEMDRAYSVVQTNYNRRLAAYQQLASVEAAYEAETAPLDLVLEAQRRLSDAETQYFRSLTEYSVAVKNVHYEKGSLLDYNQVYLSEGLWPTKAYYQAVERFRLRTKPIAIRSVMHTGPDVSAGEHPQIIEPLSVDDWNGDGLQPPAGMENLPPWPEGAPLPVPPAPGVSANPRPAPAVSDASAQKQKSDIELLSSESPAGGEMSIPTTPSASPAVQLPELSPLPSMRRGDDEEMMR